jgi:hypothetical protein
MALSELVTNAIKYGSGGPVRLGIQCISDQLRVEVHDASSSLPVLMNAPLDATVGRSLVLVASLSTDCPMLPAPGALSGRPAPVRRVRPDQPRPGPVRAWRCVVPDLPVRPSCAGRERAARRPVSSLVRSGHCSCR